MKRCSTSINDVLVSVASQVVRNCIPGRVSSGLAHLDLPRWLSQAQLVQSSSVGSVKLNWLSQAQMVQSSSAGPVKLNRSSQTQIALARSGQAEHSQRIHCTRLCMQFQPLVKQLAQKQGLCLLSDVSTELDQQKSLVKLISNEKSQASSVPTSVN